MCHGVAERHHQHPAVQPVPDQLLQGSVNVSVLSRCFFVCSSLLSHRTCSLRVPTAGWGKWAGALSGSPTCGKGTRERTRGMTNTCGAAQPQTQSYSCGSNCPVVYGAKWSGWLPQACPVAACSKGGTRYRTRTTSHCGTWSSQSYPSDKLQACDTCQAACEGAWTEWGNTPWTSPWTCVGTCTGTGTPTRWKTISRPQKACYAAESKTKEQTQGTCVNCGAVAQCGWGPSIEIFHVPIFCQLLIVCTI